MGFPPFDKVSSPCNGRAERTTLPIFSFFQRIYLYLRSLQQITSARCTFEPSHTSEISIVALVALVTITNCLTYHFRFAVKVRLFKGFLRGLDHF